LASHVGFGGPNFGSVSRHEYPLHRRLNGGGQDQNRADDHGGEIRGGVEQAAIGITYTILLGVFLFLPVLRLLWPEFGPKRSRRGHCRKCGYDLRATPDRCPECGTIPAFDK
jgi:hypothetical protein